MKFFKKTSVISCYHFSSSVPHSTDLFGSVTLSAVTGGSCRSLASTVPILFRYPFGAPLRSHLLYLSVPFLSAIRNVLCKTSMINTLFLIAFAYSYSSTGNPDCQCSFYCDTSIIVYNIVIKSIDKTKKVHHFMRQYNKLPKQALVILGIALVLIISTVLWSSSRIT